MALFQIFLPPVDLALRSLLGPTYGIAILPAPPRLLALLPLLSSNTTALGRSAWALMRASCAAFFARSMRSMRSREALQAVWRDDANRGERDVGDVGSLMYDWISRTSSRSVEADRCVWIAVRVEREGG